MLFYRQYALPAMHQLWNRCMLLVKLLTNIVFLRYANDVGNDCSKK